MADVSKTLKLFVQLLETVFWMVDFD
jgi:hypothetical protein